MMKQYFFGDQWYIAVPVSDLPKIVGAPDAEDLAEPVEDAEARIIEAMGVWLWRKTRRNRPPIVHLKDENKPRKGKKRE